MNTAIAYTLFVLILLSWACDALASESASQRYVQHFLRLYPERQVTALELQPTIEKYSAQHNIDPLLINMLISWESGYRADADNGKDYGLMQIRRGSVCAKGHDLTTTDGQLKAGVACVARARDACNGKLKQTLTMYASGRCVSASKTTKRRINHRVRIFEKWSNK